MSLLNNVKDVFNDEIMDNVSDMLGMQKSKTSSALDTFLPGLLGGIAHKGSSIKGADSILGIIKTNGFNTDDAFDLNGIFENKDKISGFLETGTSILESLFGNKHSGLLDILLRKSGLNKSKGTKFLSFLTPIVLGKIAGTVKTGEFDAKGLSNFLSVENKDLLGMIPGLGSVFSKSKSEPKYHSIKDSISETPKSTGGWWKWLFPILLFLGLLWILI